MAYITRTTGTRFRHDPASRGIFIHGGTVCCSPAFRAECTAEPNRFTLTCAAEPHAPPVRPHALTLPTFGSAVDAAKRLRGAHPQLHGCFIYACTDLQHDGPGAARHALQLVA